MRFFYRCILSKSVQKSDLKYHKIFFFWNVKLFILSKYDQKNNIKPKSVIFFKDHLFFTVEIKEKKVQILIFVYLITSGIEKAREVKT